MSVRRRQVATAALILAGLLAAGLFTSSAATERPAAATLALVDSSPLRFAGRHFAPGERVAVRVRMGGIRRTRHVTAGARGRFRARFRRLRLDRCGGGLTARATGSEGNRATYKRAKPQCPPPLDPPGSAPPRESGPSGDPPADPCSSGESTGAQRQCPPALRPAA